MKAVPLNKIRYKDDLTKKRQRRFLARTSGIIFAIIIVLGGAVYGLFFSHWLDVTNVTIDGLGQTRATMVQEIINKQLGRHWLGIPVGRNELFLPASGLESSISSASPFVASINIEKVFPHTLDIKVKERQPEGIWCFGSTGHCSYFDHDGILIGPAPQTSGYLILNVNDERSDSSRIESAFLRAIQTVVVGLKEQNIQIKSILVPADTYTEFHALTADYPIRFSTDTDLPTQLHALEVFLGKQSASAGFQYIDLRFDGRIYSK